MTFSLCLKGVTTLLHANFCLPARDIETFLYNHLAGQNVGKKIVRKTRNLWRALSPTYWFYVLFYNTSIAIGSDEMIGKECFFVYFSIRLFEISPISVPQKSKLKIGPNWPPGSRNRNWGNIFILSVRKVVFWVRVIFVCIFPRLPLQRYSCQQMWHLSHSHLPK